MIVNAFPFPFPLQINAAQRWGQIKEAFEATFQREKKNEKAQISFKKCFFFILFSLLKRWQRLQNSPLGILKEEKKSIHGHLLSLSLLLMVPIDFFLSFSLMPKGLPTFISLFYILILWAPSKIKEEREYLGPTVIIKCKKRKKLCWKESSGDKILVFFHFLILTDQWLVFSRVC